MKKLIRRIKTLYFSWKIYKIIEWVTNKHWKGSDPKPHYFCFKKHYSGMVVTEPKKYYEGYTIELFGIVLFKKEIELKS